MLKKKKGGGGEQKSTLKTFCLAYTSVFQKQAKIFDYTALTETSKAHTLTF